MFKYLRFYVFTLLYILGTAVSFVLGGAWMWYGTAFTFIVGIGVDLVFRWKDTADPEYGYPWLMDALLHLNTALSVLMLVLFVWALSPSDLFGIGAWVQTHYGYDALGMRRANTGLDYLGAAYSLGFVLAIETMVIGHELVSRTWDPLSMFTGRWAFALMFGTNFATEHVFGHHNNVGYPELDPVSVRRGRNFFYFTTAGTVHQWLNGWHIEANRLARNGKSVLSSDNQILRAWLRGLVVAAFVAWGAGWKGFGYYFIAVVVAKLLLESLNYFSHYGIVREKGKPIGLRHTFSDLAWMSNTLMYNLGRHGHHHFEPVPYYKCKAYADMPMTPYSYLTMGLLSMIPPLYFKVMVPVVKKWDAKYATPGERALAEKANAESGIPGLSSGEGVAVAHWKIKGTET
jgi:alkane 1-monooxygenase